MQVAAGRIHLAWAAQGAPAQYGAVFLFLGAMTALGLAVYLFSRDRVD
jgi:hypothetical protein